MRAVHLVLLIGACAAVYSNSRDHAFHLDSLHTIVDNAAIRSLDSIPRFFVDAATSSTLLSNVDYRPVLMVSYALNHWLAGYEMAGWHLVQVLLHVCCVLSLYLVCIQITRRSTSGPSGRLAANLACVTALLFAVHPTASGVVNYLSARSSLLTAAFLFIAILLYLGRADGRHRVRFTLWSTLPFALALFTKVEAVAALGVFFMIEAWEQRRRRGSTSGLLVDLLENLRPSVLKLLAPHLAIVAVYFVIRADVMADMPFGESSRQPLVTRSDYFLTQAVAWWYYVHNWFVPFHLVADHPSFPIHRAPWEPVVLLSLASWGVVVALLVSQWKARPELVVPAVSALALISPTSSVVPLAEMVNEHRPYMPLSILSLCWMLPLGALWKGLPAGSGWLKTCLAVFGIAAVIAFGRATYERNLVFQTEDSYWSDILDKEPSWRAHNNYARTLMKKAEYPAALEHLKETLKMEPGYYIAHTNIAVVYAKMGEEELADAHHDKAVQFDRYTATALMWRAEHHLERERYGEALADFQHSLSKSLEEFRCFKGIATAQAGLGNAAGCFEATSRCLDLDSEKTQLGIIPIVSPFFGAPERYEAGIEYFDRLKERLPDTWWVYENTARLATLLGRTDLARTMTERSLELQKR